MDLRLKSISFLGSRVAGEQTTLLIGESQSAYKRFDEYLGNILLPFLYVRPDLPY